MAGKSQNLEPQACAGRNAVAAGLTGSVNGLYLFAHDAGHLK